MSQISFVLEFVTVAAGWDDADAEGRAQCSEQTGTEPIVFLFVYQNL